MTAAGLRRSELIHRLERIPPFARPRADLEQVVTPAEAAAELLFEALGRGDLEDQSVLDLGSGTGRLAFGAAWLGARSVRAIEVDADAVSIARTAARTLGLPVEFEERAVDGAAGAPVDTVVMNPPFGAQRRGADRPFWEAAFRLARGAIYAFALSDSRTFIAHRAVERGAHVESNRPIAWELPRIFPHHRRATVRLAVDLWAIRIGPPP